MTAKEQLNNKQREVDDKPVGFLDRGTRLCATNASTNHHGARTNWALDLITGVPEHLSFVALLAWRHRPPTPYFKPQLFFLNYAQALRFREPCYSLLTLFNLLHNSPVDSVTRTKCLLLGQNTVSDLELPKHIPELTLMLQ